jgi:ribosomal protein S18 acetylase RimI-like enzyme
MTDYLIRPATSHDLDALGRLGAILMRAHFAFDNDRFMRPGADAEGGYAWFLGTQLDDPESLVLVAERQGVVIGYLYAGIEPLSWKELRERAGFIHDVLVDEWSRRLGIAEALLDAAITWLKEKDVPRVILWTAAPNEQAQRLFARKGFRMTMFEMTLELGQRSVGP